MKREIMKLSIEEKAGFTIIKVDGQLSGGEETDKFFDAIKSSMDKGKTKFVLDLSRVIFISSIVIGLLVRANRDILGVKGSLVVCGLNKTMQEIFVITKVASILTMTKDVESAIEILEAEK